MSNCPPAPSRTTASDPPRPPETPGNSGSMCICDRVSETPVQPASVGDARANKKFESLEDSDLDQKKARGKAEQNLFEVPGKQLSAILTECKGKEETLDPLEAPQPIVEVTPDTGSTSGNLKHVKELVNLGATAYDQFERTGNVRDITRAIEYWETAFALSSGLQMDISGLMRNIGCAYQLRFNHVGELSDLNKAIESQAKAVGLVPDGRPGKPEALNNLGVSYQTRFGRLGKLADLEKAIELQAQAVALCHDTDLGKPRHLSNLGVSYIIRFGRLGELCDLHKSIGYQLKAVSLTPNGHSGKPGLLSNLGNSYGTRFGRLGEISDLNKAIEFQAHAVALTPDGHLSRPGYLNNLGWSYRTRFERLGELSDLGNAIEFQVQAVSLSPHDHPDKPVRLVNLGISYCIRFKRLGELSDLDDAIENQAQAILLSPDGHPRKPGFLNSLGVSYETRFRRLGELSDLNNAIEFQAQAVSLTADDHPDKRAGLSNLGNSYVIRFARLGELSDLNKAIDSQVKAVVLTPDGDVNKAGFLNNLGYSYQTRFRHLGELSDLENTIEFQAQAVSLSPDGHPDKPGRLSNLGNSYMIRFGRLGELSDLNKAIESQAQAISLTPDDHPDKPARHSNLGIPYETRFSRLSESSDLNKAIESKARAVALTPEGHPDKPKYLNNLGCSYQTRFRHLGELSDLENAIESQAQAISLTPDDHPDKPSRLSNLGKSYQIRSRHLMDPSDVRLAVRFLRRAAQSPTGSAWVRFRACREWAGLALLDTSSSPRVAYNHAMQLLPQLVWIGTTLDRRYELIKEVGDFAAEAASYAISVSAYNLALEWLEVGRSIVWHQTAMLRNPFDQLAIYDSELASQLQDVGCKLEKTWSRSSNVPGAHTGDWDIVGEANSHMELALSWDNLSAKARSIPGYHDVLHSLPSSQLLSAAKDGPVAVINLHRSRCDALILWPNTSTISHVPLEEFSQEVVISARENLVSLLGQRGFKKAGDQSDSNANRHGSLEESFKRLWLGIVMPVLDHLGILAQSPSDALPHITWCITGLLSFLPLHAAGCYDRPGSNTFDHVVSSYTPTLGMLISSQLRPACTTYGIVAVGQEHTPGFCSLPFVSDELKVIDHHAHAHGYLQLKDGEATIDQVLDSMDQFGWVHMACHGTQDTVDPTQSAFHLYDGPLTLAMITKKSFADKGLAFLSACQTATGDETMPDEAIHLAAGMLMAGYPSVIGTMWSIADEDGPAVADRVYAELLRDGKMDRTKAARALHQAVAELRAKVGKKHIARWAPFIHMGS